MARKPTNSAKKTAAKTAARKLTPKQELFVKEYLKDFNATQAAIRCGYSENTARQQGSRLLTNVDIAEAIAKTKNARIAKFDISAERILEEMARLAFLDIGKAFDEGGNLKPLHEMDEDTRRAISGLEVTALHHDGIKIGTLSKLKLTDKRAALVDLAKHSGHFDQKVSVADDGLSLLIQTVQGSSFKPVANPSSEDDE